MDTKIFITLLILILTACSQPDSAPSREYGVFLGLDNDDMAAMEDHRTIVIDAQYFTAQDISSLKASGHRVLSYINLGALENFRPYYKEYEQYTLDVYENWEEEKWVDVSAGEWQDFMAQKSSELMAKGCDGLFVDNADVYYHYHTQKIFDGVTHILKDFKDKGAYVSVNGGDVYITEYADRYGDLDIIDAVNQETVFSSIDFEQGTFGEQAPAEREYFTDYTHMVKSMGKDVYLLEYTTDQKLIAEIEDFCAEKGYICYISSTIELLG